MMDRVNPSAYVKVTDHGIEVVSGELRLRGTLDVLHRAIVEDVQTGEQFQVKYTPWRGMMGMSITSAFVRA